ncbi:MAG: sulfite exporter TauE/SafE family protein [Oscillospiraceae bacterium]|nr:sulfite exporter TauE/SafE family protein [Oscillospiraceae bacterium]
MVGHPVVSIFVGMVLGFLTGLGTGGGSLLVLWLTLVAKTPQASAKIINLMFFLPCALIASILNWKKGRISFKKLLLPTLSGCLMAALFSFLGKKIDTEGLQKLFGVLLIIIGARELFYRQRKPR